MIDNEEFRNLFRAEAAEHLQVLDDGLLRIEQTPDDHATLENLFRATHSLKGDARMVGCFEVEQLAHAMEDLLRPLAKQAEGRLEAETIGRLSSALVPLRALVAEAVDGTVSAVVLQEELARLSDEYTAEEVQVAPPVNDMPYRIDTVRVSTALLDTLLSDVGELIVIRSQLSRRLVDAESIYDQWDQWQRQGNANVPVLETLLTAVVHAKREDLVRLDQVSARLAEAIRTLRLLPLSTLFNQFPRMVHDIAQSEGRQVQLLIRGESTGADKRIIEELKDPLLHALRNAVSHGIEASADRLQAGKPEQGTIWLSAHREGAHVVVEIEDDGRGLDFELIENRARELGMLGAPVAGQLHREQLVELLFRSGFTTRTEVDTLSGRGVGLDVVRSHVERLKGEVTLGNRPDGGSCLRFRLPSSLATSRVLMVRCAGQVFGIPVEAVLANRYLAPAQLFPLEDHIAVEFHGEPLLVRPLIEILELGKDSVSPNEDRAALFISAGEARCALLVDVLIDEREVVLKPPGALLQRVRNTSGTAVLETGEICIVLNPADLVLSVLKGGAPAVTTEIPEQVNNTDQAQPVVLLVEDQIITRTQEVRILQGAGYRVVVAVDGLDGFEKLAEQPVDAVVSDINMPNMDGLELTRRIRADKNHAELPVILLTTMDSVEDRKLGLEAGASAYLSKSLFNQDVLLETLQRLTGRSR